MKPIQLQKGDKITINGEVYEVDEVFQDDHMSYCINTKNTSIFVGIDEEIEVIKTK